MKKILLAGIVAALCGCYKYTDEAYDAIMTSPEIFETFKAKGLRIYRVKYGDDGAIIAVRLSFEKENALDKERAKK